MIKNIRESYKAYPRRKEVEMKDYLTLTSRYNKFLMNKVLEGKEVTLPSRLGTLAVIGRKQNVRIVDGEIKGLAPDWVKTKALWARDPKAKEERKRLFHLNNHTDNVRFKIRWSKRVNIENKTLYSFRATRDNKRGVHRRIIEGVNYITK